MAAERTDFVDVLPINSLKTALAFVKGGTVSARDMYLAADNIFSYAGGQFLPGAVPMFASRQQMMTAAAAAQPATQAEVEAAFAAVMPDPSGAMKAASVGRLDWATILKTMLPFLLGLL